MAGVRDLPREVLHLAAESSEIPDLVRGWLSTFSDDPIHPKYKDEARVLLGGFYGGSDRATIEVQFAPEVYIEGGYIVTFHPDNEPTVIRIEGRRKTAVLHPDLWIDFATKLLGKALVCVTVRVSVTKKDLKSDFSWELHDPYFEIAKLA